MTQAKAAGSAPPEYLSVLSLLAPAVVGIDKIIQPRRQRVPRTGAEA